jgi:hypothetical protein
MQIFISQKKRRNKENGEETKSPNIFKFEKNSIYKMFQIQQQNFQQDKHEQTYTKAEQC